jgi:hypothetical protein
VPIDTLAARATSRMVVAIGLGGERSAGRGLVDFRGLYSKTARKIPWVRRIDTRKYPYIWSKWGFIVFSKIH